MLKWCILEINIIQIHDNLYGINKFKKKTGTDSTPVDEEGRFTVINEGR